ncbi:MAG: diacylglycerol kinase family protein [Ktedonobacterales bacterium]|nr:diacylglycerol kinase family protein [Ktedonobacterales bacterium]
MKTTPPRRRGAAPHRTTQAHAASGGAPRAETTTGALPAPAQHARDARAALAAQPAPARASFLRSFVYAWNGLWYALRTQRNARVHVALALCAIVLGFVLRLSPVEFAMIFVAITSVFIAEMFNTVAEACVDLATQEFHPLARIAKDVAAGAVLLSAMLSVVIALLVYGPHLWPLLRLAR